MYNAEVLSKFPVVQHFPFGSLFSWEKDPTAQPPPTSTHVANQPSSHTVSVTGDTGGALQSRPAPQDGTRAPWASQSSHPNSVPTTTAPWAKQPTAAPLQQHAMPPTRAPWASSGAGPGIPTRAALPSQAQGMPPTRAPWASADMPPTTLGGDVPTSAPWAKQPSNTPH
jgi:serine/threonine-protein phosphatase 2A activator